MSLAILYEYPETDELGIKLTADEMGVKLTYIPFRKISVSIGKDGYSFKSKGKDFHELLENTNAVLNRAQSKNRRIYAASLLEAFGKFVVNPLSVETLCFSKFRTLVEFWRRGIDIPKTVYVPCDAHDQSKTGLKISNEEEIADLIQNSLGEGNVVVKPDGGSHGNDVRLAKDRKDLVQFLESTEPSIVNPLGFVAQEFVKKWFYDLRIIVAKERGKDAYCFPTALARAGFKDFRTNTYLGNMVFGVNLPLEVRDVAIKCGRAVGKDSEAWVLALDAMFDIGEDRSVDDAHIKSELEKLVTPFEAVKEVKKDDTKFKDFPAWNKRLEAAYQKYKNTEAYQNVKKIIEDSIKRQRHKILFHEANSCPEFWEQTRIIAGVNVAVPLIKCARSVEGWSIYQRVREDSRKY